MDMIFPREIISLYFERDVVLDAGAAPSKLPLIHDSSLGKNASSWPRTLILIG